MSVGRASIAIGFALFASHLAAATLIAEDSDNVGLSVVLDTVQPRRSRVLAADRDRVRLAVNGETQPADRRLPPGTHYLTWTERYRGGHVRRVGSAVHLGPRQDPKSPPCSARLRIGQKLLDDGTDSGQSVATIARRLLDAELSGLTLWPVGSFRGTESLRLRWFETADRDDAVASLAATAMKILPPRFIILTAELVFTRIRVPILVVLVPELTNGSISLRAMANARVTSDSRVYRFVIDVLNGDRRATEVAQEQLRGAIVELLEPPPPIELPGGGRIRVDFCRHGALRFRTDAYGEVPLTIALENARGDQLPLLTAPAANTPPDTVPAHLQLELDIDALAGLLHQLWASGFLDRELAAADLVGAFNRDPQVRNLLSLRARELRINRPPVVAAVNGGFDLGVELEAVIEDGSVQTQADLFARAHLFVANGEAGLISELKLRQVGLTCRPAPQRLTACYSTLTSELERQAPAASKVVADWLENSFANLIRDRELAIDGVPASLRIKSEKTSERSGRLVIDLDASLVEAPATE